MVDREKIRLWIETLLSGEYEQGYHQLRSGDTFCCLGVACDIYKKETGEGRWTETGTFYPGESGSKSSTTLPVKVREWFGLEDNDPLITKESPGCGMTLSDLNDDYNDFNEIASYIEAEYLSV